MPRPSKQLREMECIVPIVRHVQVEGMNTARFSGSLGYEYCPGGYILCLHDQKTIYVYRRNVRIVTSRTHSSTRTRTEKCKNTEHVGEVRCKTARIRLRCRSPLRALFRFRLPSASTPYISSCALPGPATSDETGIYHPPPITFHVSKSSHTITVVPLCCLTTLP